MKRPGMHDRTGIGSDLSDMDGHAHIITGVVDAAAAAGVDNVPKAT